MPGRKRKITRAIRASAKKHTDPTPIATASSDKKTKIRVNFEENTLHHLADDDFVKHFINYLSEAIKQDKALIDPFTLSGDINDYELPYFFVIRPKYNRKNQEGYAIEIFNMHGPVLGGEPEITPNEFCSRVYPVIATLNLINGELLDTKNKPRVIKVITERTADQTYSFYSRFFDQEHKYSRATNEIRHAAKLGDRGIKAGIDIGQHDMRFFKAIVMHRMPGIDFLTYYNTELDKENSALKQGEPLYLLTLMAHMIQAYHDVYSQDILHASVKLEHFIIDPETLSMKLIDLGSSRTLDEIGPRAGSHMYAAPEIKAGQINTIDSDIYSLGFCLQKIASHLKDQNDLLESELGRLLLAMCSDQPADRPSFEEILQMHNDILCVIQAILAEQAVQGETPPAFSPTPQSPV